MAKERDASLKGFCLSHSSRRAKAHAAAPNLRHCAVNVEQGVDRLYTGAHGIFGGEYGVARSLGKLTDKGEVHSAVRYYWTVPQRTDKQKSSLSQNSGELHGLAPDLKRSKAVF